MTVAACGGPATATTLAIVATDAPLDKRQAHRLAAVAATGLAKSLRLAQAAMDGDTVFAVATGDGSGVDLVELTELGAVASDALARAVARGIYEASRLPGHTLPAWREKFNDGRS